MSSKSSSVLDFFLFKVNWPFLGCFAFDVGVRGWKFGSDSAVLLPTITSCPSKAFTWIDRWRRNSVFELGIDSRDAIKSAVNLFSKTMRAPWTPLPLRLGAYSDRSTCRSHSITLKYVVSVLYLTNANVRLISQTMKTNSALRMRRVPAGNNLLCLEQHKRHV